MRRGLSQCVRVASHPCSAPPLAQTRVLVYAAAGLDPATGQPADCGRAGRVRLHAVQAAGPGPQGTALSVEWAGVTREERLVIPDTAA